MGGLRDSLRQYRSSTHARIDHFATLLARADEVIE
jgi:hypothetical protein